MANVNRETQYLFLENGRRIVRWLPNLSQENIAHILRLVEILLPFTPIIAPNIAFVIGVVYYFKSPVAVDRTSRIFIAVINQSGEILKSMINYFFEILKSMVDHFFEILKSMVDHFFEILKSMIDHFFEILKSMINHCFAIPTTTINLFNDIRVSYPEQGIYTLLLFLVVLSIVGVLCYTIFITYFFKGNDRIWVMVIEIVLFIVWFWWLFSTSNLILNGI
ncbi:hypothetical protein EAF04_004943 [Stromatinia cepivora]|nr:hypothetical protein EAF04_004943 [Stromatinia cepivora]